MHDIILHHYPQSPVAEKVRVALGVKQLSWRSVEIPRLPPKPDLVPLTGGYRRTPVMQIGADIYCDSQCIIRELQRRFPEPCFNPVTDDGLCWALSRWTDDVLFYKVVTVALGAVEELPEAFASDRLRIYFGPDSNIGDLRNDVQQALVQLRAQFGWIEQRLESGREFLIGKGAGAADIFAYYLVWFLRGRYEKGPEFLSQFPRLVAWEGRVKAIGHGQSSEISAAEALDIARNATSETPEHGDNHDPQGLKPGMHVGVAPAEDSGDPVVSGVVVCLDAETIAIRHKNERVGEVVVHFPRVGSRVSIQ
jgi:glutathione S-transferase